MKNMNELKGKQTKGRNRVRNTVFVLLFSFATASAQHPVEQANEAYSAGDFQQAAELYQSALEEYGASAAVYYNLGNAFYRLNRIAPAVLNYERALLFDPGNKDIRFNLEIAKLKTVDKIEPVGTFFLSEWYESLQNRRNTNQWSAVAIGCFVLFIACLFLFFFSRKTGLKKAGFYAGAGLLLLCLAANGFACGQKKKLTHRNTAIIFAPTITIKSAPDRSGTDLFILHEGTKVEITNTLGDWKEIETAGGNVGWIKKTEIEII
ncbi:MAG: tetratricopeptide repeat protein [Dysgonamonadaceae bacterium]|jgi:tetratricopeptide (TPR) repeat protein|nr:tetratricopeptide repeat protein [Dysgonamonadaceae bacterium]